LADEVLEHVDVFVVDPLDLLGGEAAKALALEKRALCGPLGLLVFAASAHECHVNSPFQ
jgi:hypothetical protein